VSTPTMTTPIIDNNALTAALRALKLGGMLQTLDARLAQARAGELGHLEFLQVLCHDEISRRETTAIARRTRRARFEQTLTLEGFDFAAAPKLPAAQIRDLAALRRLHNGESILLHGPVGVRKTHSELSQSHRPTVAGLDTAAGVSCCPGGAEEVTVPIVDRCCHVMNFFARPATRRPGSTDIRWCPD
jgi:hypothetical protein